MIIILIQIIQSTRQTTPSPSTLPENSLHLSKEASVSGSSTGTVSGKGVVTSKSDELNSGNTQEQLLAALKNGQTQLKKAPQVRGEATNAKRLIFMSEVLFTY